LDNKVFVIDARCKHEDSDDYVCECPNVTTKLLYVRFCEILSKFLDR